METQLFRTARHRYSTEGEDFLGMAGAVEFGQHAGSEIDARGVAAAGLRTSVNPRIDFQSDFTSVDHRRTA
jgi:hypothetical protein